MLDLQKILQETAEFAKKRDAATPGEWYPTLDNRFIYVNSPSRKETVSGTLINQQLIADVVNRQISHSEIAKNATFIAAAKNFDSVTYIRELVAEIKMLKQKHEDDYKRWVVAIENAEGLRRARGGY